MTPFYYNSFTRYTRIIILSKYCKCINSPWSQLRCRLGGFSFSITSFVLFVSSDIITPWFPSETPCPGRTGVVLWYSPGAISLLQMSSCSFAYDGASLCCLRDSLSSYVLYLLSKKRAIVWQSSEHLPQIVLFLIL